MQLCLAGKFNVAFAACYILGDVHQCVDMLLEIGRVPEAALFARTYVPSRIGEVVKVWKKELSNISDVLGTFQNIVFVFFLFTGKKREEK